MRVEVQIFVKNNTTNLFSLRCFAPAIFHGERTAWRTAGARQDRANPPWKVERLRM
jgi:hypothetical protein